MSLNWAESLQLGSRAVVLLRNSAVFLVELFGLPFEVFLPFQLVLEGFVCLFLRDAIKLLTDNYIFVSQPWVCELR